MSLNKGVRSTFPQHSGFVGKAPRTFSRGGSSRPPPHGNRVASRAVVIGISMAASATSHSSPTTQAGPRPSQGEASRGRGSRGRNSFQSDAGASPAKHVWRPAGCTSTYFEVFLNSKVGILM
jgi:hypothetical protein